MDRRKLLKILEEVKSGRLSVDAACSLFQDLQTEDLGFASIDHHRAVRLGFPEVIFGEGKTAQQIASIFKSLQAKQSTVLATRVDNDKALKVLEEIPELQHNPIARTLLYSRQPIEIQGGGTILIACAGSSDLPVAEEAANYSSGLG